MLNAQHQILNDLKAAFRRTSRQAALDLRLSLVLIGCRTIATKYLPSPALREVSPREMRLRVSEGKSPCSDLTSPAA